MFLDDADPPTVFKAALGAGVALLVVALLATVLKWDTVGVVLIAVIVLLIALLATELYVLRRTQPAPAPAIERMSEASAHGEPTELRPVRRLTIRCKACGQVFTITDDGTRPLVHACPSCGKSGKLAERATG